MSFHSHTFTFGDQEITLETGKVARQATGSVTAKMGNNVVLATVVANPVASAGQDFFPLSVHYQEKAYAVGRIPAGFIKRETKPSEREVLTARLIDRPIRPLFPKGFLNEVQIMVTVLSSDKETPLDILSMLAVSASLGISGIPFMAPIGAARVGFTEEKGYILNPHFTDLPGSELDMVVAGTEDAILMVESEADELIEDEMLGAVLFAQHHYRTAIAEIKTFIDLAGKPKWDWQAPDQNEALMQHIKAYCEEGIQSGYAIAEKIQRNAHLSEVRKRAVEKILQEKVDKNQSISVDLTEEMILAIIGKIEKQFVRERILNGLPRIDGRPHNKVRPIQSETKFLPSAHGSALFTRGETQALAVATLGAGRDAQMIDSLEGEHKENFMLHYNFPPYSVNECGRIGPPGRREIGHGRLAKRGIQAVLPNMDDFPYTIRVVSEITESNGSSSMATVCGTSLALMDAGVPLKAPVAGIAMGLVKEGDQFAILTDILGDEDHLGDMDFKVAGTANGITALQMDIKIAGITEKIMETALQQALEARLHILSCMNQTLAQSRNELSANAPTLMNIIIDPEKIRDVIGKGGATIRSICEETGASIDIEDNGAIKIFAENQEKCQLAHDKIIGLTAEAEIGKTYTGSVIKITDFGAFVNFLPSQDGLVHISQIAEERVENIEAYLKIGQKVNVVVTGIDSRGRVKLSIKDAVVD